jgi:hypothetical protein
MCHQTVGLIQGFIEEAGIPTVGISLLKEVSLRVAPTRTLWVPFPMGFPMGEPLSPETQTKVLLAALDLLGRASSAPILSDFSP